MLPKKNRADKKMLGDVFAFGKSINSPNLLFKFTLAKENFSPRVSFTAPKNVASQAVKRNALRRRGYNSLKKFIQDFPLGLTGIFIFKKILRSAPEVEKEIKIILDKLRK